MITEKPNSDDRVRAPAKLTVRARGVAVAIAAGAAVSAFAGVANSDPLAVACTNPYSGAAWRIMIDYERSTVDDNPAQISGAEISWRDSKDGWRYTLDRKSGKLTVVLASATGGNFLHDQCKMPN